MTEREANLAPYPLNDSATPYRHFARSINVGQLVLGFGAGQGSIFLAQTWLVHSHQLELLGQFGTMFSFATLAAYVVDMGALTTLARRVANAMADPDRPQAIWPMYWAVTAGRIGTAASIIAAAFIVAMGASQPFLTSYTAAAAPALFIWSFNAAGILDGLRRSGLSGIALACPYLASACVLPFMANTEPFISGAMLGAAFTAGTILSVALHFANLHALGFAVRFVRPTPGAIFQASREGAAMLIFLLPSQIFFRIQIVLCGALLGPAMTGLFVYAKQITNALGQLIGFVRRVEFPALVRQFAVSSREYLARTITVLGGALAAAATAAGILAAVALLAGPHLGGGLRNAAGIVAWFSPVVLTGALGQTLSQGFLAMGRLATVAWTANLAMLVGIVLSVAAPVLLGLPGFVAAEVAMHLAAVGLMLVAYRRIAEEPRRG